MVCDGAMIASTIVSLMTNGVCCLWQHQEEVDRRETIRRDIRAEYWQQRLIDHEFVMALTCAHYLSQAIHISSHKKFKDTNALTKVRASRRGIEMSSQFGCIPVAHFRCMVK